MVIFGKKQPESQALVSKYSIFSFFSVKSFEFGFTRMHSVSGKTILLKRGMTLRNCSFQGIDAMIYNPLVEESHLTQQGS